MSISKLFIRSVLELRPAVVKPMVTLNSIMCEALSVSASILFFAAAGRLYARTHRAIALVGRSLGIHSSERAVDYA